MLAQPPLSASPAGSWTAQSLLECLSLLDSTLTLTSLEESDVLLNEVQALIAGHQDKKTFVACVCALLARKAHNPVLTYGLWSRTVIFSRLQTTFSLHDSNALPVQQYDCSVETSNYSYSFTSLLAEEPIHFLVPLLPNLTFLELVNSVLEPYHLRVILIEQSHTLSLALATDPEHVVVEFGVSPLWQALHLLLDLCQREQGSVSAYQVQRYRMHPTSLFLRSSLLGTPRWVAEASDVADFYDFLTYWYEKCINLSDRARAALETRSLLVWHFAMLADTYPLYGWLALAVSHKDINPSQLLQELKSIDLQKVSRDQCQNNLVSADTCYLLADWIISHGLSDILATSPDGLVSVKATLATDSLSSRCFTYDNYMFHLHVADYSLDSSHFPTVQITLDSVPQDTLGAISYTVNDVQLLVSASLLSNLPKASVEIAILLSGDRGVDLQCVDRLIVLLKSHPGTVPVQFMLIKAEARKRLDLSTSTQVSWSRALVDALEHAQVVKRGGVLLKLTS